MDNQNFLLVFITIVFIFSLIFCIVPLTLLWEFFVRPIKLKKLAEKYGLRYKRWDSFFDSEEKRNFISGKVGKNNIKIHDMVVIHGWKIRLGERMTKITINNKTEFVKSFLSGYATVSEIENKLRLLTGK